MVPSESAAAEAPRTPTLVTSSLATAQVPAWSLEHWEFIGFFSAPVSQYSDDYPVQAGRRGRRRGWDRKFAYLAAIPVAGYSSSGRLRRRPEPRAAPAA